MKPFQYKLIKVITILVVTMFIYQTKSFAQAGTFDTSFGNKGEVILSGRNISRPFSGIALQSNEKIVVTGGASAVFTCRYRKDGTLDSVFGNNGIVKTSFDNFATGIDAAIQQDGKIVVAGYAMDYFFTSSTAFLLRFLRNGTLDKSFGDMGNVTFTDISGLLRLTNLFIQPDGKILCIGSGAGTKTYADFLLYRFNANGSFDSSFGKNGESAIDFNHTGDYPTHGILKPNGRIVVVGSSQQPDKQEMAETGPQGHLAQKFGNDGKVLKNGLFFSAITMQSTGRLIIAATDSLMHNYFMAYTSSGVPDSSFGINGEVYNRISFSTTNLIVQGDDKIIGVGDSASNLLVYRLLPNGDPDTDFGNGGITTLVEKNKSSFAEGVVLQNDNKILVCGYRFGETGLLDGLIIRLNNDNVSIAVAKTPLSKPQPDAIVTGTY